MVEFASAMRVQLKSWIEDGRDTSLLVVVLIGCCAGVAAVHLDSLIDPGRLIPISAMLVLQSIPITLFLYSIGFVIVARRVDVPGAIGVFSVAFALRAMLAVVSSAIFQFDDERIFHAAGVAQSYGLLSWNAGSAYYLVVSWLYLLFGPNILLPKMVNVFFGSLLPILIFDLANWLYHDDSAARRGMLFAAFLPPLVVFSAANLKEVLTAFLLVYVMWLALVPRWHGVRRAVSVAALIGCLYWLRDVAWTAVATAGIVAHLVLGRTWSPRRRTQSHLPSRMLVGALLAASLLLILGPPLQRLVHSRTTQEAYFIHRFTGSSATVVKFLNVSTPLAPKNLGILALRGLYAPTPLRVTLDYGLDTLAEAANMMTWYVLVPFAAVGVMASRRSGDAIACVVIAVGVLALAAGGIMVGSDPYRHRIAMFGILCVLSARGFDPTARRYMYVHVLWWTGGLVFTSLWFALRI